MPNFRVTGPDGRVYRVTAPEGATQEEVLARVQAQVASAQPSADSMTPEQQEARLRELVPGVSVDPTVGMGFGSRLAAGFGKSFVDTGRGIGQLVGAVDQASVDESAALDAPLMNTAGGLVGNVGGQITQVVIPAGGAARVGGTVGRIGSAVLNPRTVANASSRVGRAAQAMGVAGAVGGTQAALQPVVTGDSRIGNALTGAALGAAGQGVFDLGAAGVQAARRVLANSTGNADVLAAQGLRTAIGDAGERALQQPPAPLVAGSDATTAEVLRRAGANDAATRAAMLERTARGDARFSPDFAQLDQARNAARVAEIERTFRGATPEDAARIRSEVATAQGPAIREARAVRGVESGRVISAIDRVANSARFRNAPTVQQALSTARGLIAQPLDDAQRISAARSVANDAMSNPGRMSSADFDAVREAARIVRGASLRGETADQALEQLRGLSASSSAARAHIANMRRTLAAAERGRPDVASLYNARKYITQTLMPRADDETMVALRGVVGRLDDQIGQAAPTFRPYLRDYAAGMRQADQAAIGATLLQRGGRPTPDSPLAAYSLGPAAFNRATANIDQLVQSATGFGRAKAASALTAEQRTAINAIRRDLDGVAFVQQQSRASNNSITAEMLSQRTQAENQISNLITSGVPLGNIAKAVFDDVSKAQADRVAEIIAAALRNPARARQILASVPANQRGRATALVEAARASSLVPGAATSTAVGFGTVLNPPPQPLELEVIGDRRIGRTIPVGP